VLFKIVVTSVSHIVTPFAESYILSPRRADNYYLPYSTISTTIYKLQEIPTLTHPSCNPNEKSIFSAIGPTPGIYLTIVKTSSK